MVFQTQNYNYTIDLSSNQTKQLAGNDFVALVTPVINNVINEIQTNNFDYTLFPFTKQQFSNLTGKSGLYLIINKKTKRIYLGSAANLAQRKGDHWRNFNTPSRFKKLALSMRTDLKAGSPNDFVFVPLLVVKKENIQVLQHKTFNQQVSEFFDTYVEGLLLNYYLTNLPDVFYNIKTVGQFMPGNTFGGAQESGLPSKPVSYTICINNQNVSYAWESITAAANTFKVDRKLIRDKVLKKKMVTLDPVEYEQFSGVKISNQEAKSFFQFENLEANRLAEYNQILSELFPNIANKRK